MARLPLAMVLAATLALTQVDLQWSPGLATLDAQERNLRLADNTYVHHGEQVAQAERDSLMTDLAGNLFGHPRPTQGLAAIGAALGETRGRSSDSEMLPVVGGFAGRTRAESDMSDVVGAWEPDGIRQAAAAEAKLEKEMAMRQEIERLQVALKAEQQRKQEDADFVKTQTLRNAKWAFKRVAEAKIDHIKDQEKAKVRTHRHTLTRDCAERWARRQRS